MTLELFLSTPYHLPHKSIFHNSFIYKIWSEKEDMNDQMILVNLMMLVSQKSILDHSGFGIVFSEII